MAIIGAVGDGVESACFFDLTTGNQLLKLTALDGALGDQFGHSGALSGGKAIIGVWTDDDAGESSGFAYLFDTATGNQIFKLTAADTAANDRFGWSIDITEELAIVGAWK